MKYEVIFCVFAILLMAAVIGLFAWRLFSGRSDPAREWRRTAENIDALRGEYERIRAARDTGGLSEKEFAEREEELALRVIDETAPETEEKHEMAERFPAVTAVAVAVIIPAVAVGGYLWYGDFSALDERAIEQIRTTREAARSEADMAETVKSLEAAVVRDKDDLEAWELLADQYNATGNLSQAQIAYENVVRLNPRNVNAMVELADITIGLDPTKLRDAGALAEKALALDPWSQKALMIGAAGAFERGDYARAAVYFARLREQFPEGSEGWRAINGQLEMTLHAGNLREVPPDPVGKKPESDM